MTSQRSNAAFDPDLEFWLMSGASTLGERGTLGGIVSVLEAGGATVGKLDASGSYIHPYTDLQLGTGGHAGDVERCRWLGTAWFACMEGNRKLLLLAHQAPSGEFRSDSGYGAKDRWVKGSDHREGQHGQTRTGIDAHLGQAVVSTGETGVRFGIAALAIKLAPDPARLLLACYEPEPLHRAGKRAGTVNREEANRRRKLIQEAKKRAEEAVEPAWAEWFESKAAADPVRRDRERRAVFLPLAPVAAE